MKLVRYISAMIFIVLVGSCTTAPAPTREFSEPEPSYAMEPGKDGTFADLEAAFTEKHGHLKSGFLLLDNNAESLRQRLMLIDEARYSLDIQYYLWYADDSGELVFKRVMDAAKRGVRVRLISDDILLISEDENIAVIDAHPNVEVRLFNPWRQYSTRRNVKTAQTLERFNYRMHNKLIVADNRIAILGGRNLGDEYFGLNSTFNFLDLDVLGVGPVARESSKLFDHFWNSPLVVPASAFGHDQPEASPEEIAYADLERLKKSERLRHIPIERQNWDEIRRSLLQRLHTGTSEVIYDTLGKDAISQEMATIMPEFSNTARRELLIVNAYVIPNEDMLNSARDLIQKGVKIRVLTNSLASQDVPAVNSHYGPWRKPILEAGIELYELRPDAAIKSREDTPPVVSGFVGLHTKASVVDRSRVYIGSFNLDPRARDFNTEMGVLIDSPELAEELAQLAEELMQPENSWRVKLNDQGQIIWQSGEDIRTRQPAQSFWQRVMDLFFKLFPSKYF
ncbi:MAG: phospholipase D family protein [Desulfobacterales bacterium]|nr:MAG: phospholipase D family protein [Desulfobacterales bacterium]